MQSIDLDQLRRLEPTDAFFSTVETSGDEVVPAGPFRAILDRRSDALWASSAVPVEPLGPAPEALGHIRTLCRVFAEHGRTPHVEFNEPVWPGLADLLKQAGFVENQREPLMLCVPSDFRPVSHPEVTVRFLQPADPDEHLAAYQTIFSEVLVDGGWRPTPAAMQRIRDEVERVKGRSHALAWLDGQPVGTGFISSSGGVAEIARVATVPVARRRGVGATLTSFMVGDRFQAGDELAWLSAADAPAQALYEKLGFRPAGDRLYYVAAS